MIGVAYTRTGKCDSSALISLTKQAENKYIVTIYSGKDAKLSQFYYDPEFYTFQAVFENKMVRASLKYVHPLIYPL